MKVRHPNRLTTRVYTNHESRIWKQTHITKISRTRG